MQSPLFSSRRDYINVDRMMNDLFYNSMKTNYEENVTKAKIAAQNVLNANNREIIIAPNPNCSWAGSSYFGNLDSLEELIASVTSINAYGTFNDAQATGTFKISYSLVDKTYDMGVNYFIVDYYNFDKIEELEELNALGIACTYELYGVYSDECRWN